MGCITAPSETKDEEIGYSNEENWIMAGTIVLPRNDFPGVFSGYSRQERFELPQTNNQKQADCDAFYVHWRSLFNNGGQQQQQQQKNGEEEDVVRNEIEMHASVFNNCCRIYSPSYRAAADPTDMNSINIAYNDIKRAFNHFLINWSGARPFILAGEGQGSYLLLKLIQEEMINSNTDRGEDLRKRMVCAYLPGCPILPSDINANSHIRVGKSPQDIKCVISWCTYYGTDTSMVAPCHYFFPGDSRKYQGDTFISEEEKSEGRYIVVNPLTWETSGDCEAKLNKGSMSVNEGVLYQKICGANLIDNGACVQVSYDGKCMYDGSEPLQCQSDFLPFWMSIRMNAAERLQNWTPKSQ